MRTHLGRWAVATLTALTLWSGGFVAAPPAVRADAPPSIDCGAGFVCGSGSDAFPAGRPIVTGQEDFIVQGTARDQSNPDDVGSPTAWGFIEEEAKAYVSALHRLDPDSRITDHARDEIRAYLIARLTAIAKAGPVTPTAAPGTVERQRQDNELRAYRQLQVLTGRAQRRAAQYAIDEYDRWNVQRCEYRWPSDASTNVDEYLNRTATKSYCEAPPELVVAMTLTPPTTQEFSAIGTAREFSAYLKDPAAQSVTQNTVRAASFFGGIVGGAVAAGVAAVVVSTVPAVSSLFVTSGSLVLFPFAAYGSASTAAGGAAAGVGGFTAAMGIGGAIAIVIFAAVVITLASIDFADQQQIRPNLVTALDNQATMPDLAALAATDAGPALLASVVLRETFPDYPDAQRSVPPAHRAEDPNFRLIADAQVDTNEQLTGASTVTSSIVVTDWDGNPHEVYLTDGWFADRRLDEQTPTYRTRIELTYWDGTPLTASVAGGQFLIVPRDQPTSAWSSDTLLYRNAGATTNSAATFTGNRAPNIAPEIIGSRVEGTTLTLKAHATDPDTGDTVTVDWLIQPVGLVNTSGLAACYLDEVKPVAVFTTDPSIGFSLNCPWTHVTGPEATVRYGQDGRYLVNAIVTDSHGARTNQVFALDIANAAPTIAVTDTSAGPVNEGGSVSYSGTVSDVGDDLTKVVIDWGDGSPSSTVYTGCNWEATPPGPDCLIGADGLLIAPTDPAAWTASHTYANDRGTGPYPVKLRAVDRQGAQSGIVDATADVQNVPPVLNLACGYTGTPILCLGTQDDRYQPAGEPVTVTGVAVEAVDPILLTIDWGDGTPTYQAPFPCVDGLPCPFTTDNLMGTASLPSPANRFFRVTHAYASVGTYQISATVNDTGTVTATAAASAVVTPARQAQTITFAPIPDTAWSIGSIVLAPTASSGQPVALAAQGSCSVAGTTLSLSQTLGTCTVTATQAGNDTWLPATQVVRSFQVTKAQAAISLTTADLVVDENGGAHPVTWTTTPSGLTGVTITYDGSGTAPTAPGSYAVVATLDNPLYVAPPATATLVIRARATVSVTQPGTVLYDGTGHGATVTTTPANLGPLTVTYNGQSALPVAAGSYAVSATLDGASWFGSGTGTFVISQRPVIVKADDLAATVNGPVPTLTWGLLSGSLVPGDSLGTVTCSTTAPVSGGKLTTAGSYPITCVVANPNANYQVITSTGTLTVQYQQAPLLSPLTQTSWKAGSNLPIKVQLFDGTGKLLADSVASSLAGACRVTATGTGAVAFGPVCLAYNAKTDIFQYDWKIPSGARGPETISVAVLYPGGQSTTRVAQLTITK